MSFEARVRALASHALRLVERAPFFQVSEVVIAIDVNRLAQLWASMDPEERFRFAYPFLVHQALCEEESPPLRPNPSVVYGYWGGTRSLEEWVSDYLFERRAFYGEARGADYSDVSIEPEAFVRDLMNYLKILYSIIEPFRPTKAGDLGKLGFYAVKLLESFLAGETGLSDFLAWLAGIVANRSSVFTQFREAVFVLPWLKRWLAESFASFFCPAYMHDIGGFADRLFEFFRDVLGFLDWLKIAVIASSGLDYVEGARTNCGFLGVARALHRALEIAYECLQPAIARVIQGIRATFRSYALADYAARLLGALFSDPVLFITFYHAYYSATSPRALHRAYVLLSEVAGVPLYAVRRIFAYLRAVGQWGYPRYLAG